jgi:hypothetical protein
MSTPDGTTLPITFTPTQLQAIDNWIARHDDPKPSREEAVAQLVSARLGADEGHQSTVIPGIVTGRDIT